MFSARRIVSYKEIPDSWLIGYFDIASTAKRVKFTSIFHPEEKTPSMYLYYSGDNIYYKCFSTGSAGTIRQLIYQMSGIPYKQLYQLIQNDYAENKRSFKLSLKDKAESNVTHHVDSIKFREWSKSDLEFWSSFGITEKILQAHNVYPLSEVVVVAVDDERIVKSYSFKHARVYGYFDKDGLYKIYMPGNKLKFFTLRTVLQGSEQCVGTSNLLITSSLKDIMSLKGIGITKIDMVAPPSETSYLLESELNIIKNTYDNVAVLFDNDVAGRKMMISYREEYNFPSVRLTLAKDPSDAVKYFGKQETLVNLVPSIHNALYVDL